MLDLELSKKRVWEVLVNNPESDEGYDIYYFASKDTAIIFSAEKSDGTVNKLTIYK